MSQAPIIRVTHDGAERVTVNGGDPYPSTGEVRITGWENLPEFDVDAVIHAHFPGIVVQANLVEAVTIWLVEHGAVSDADEAAILALANAILAGEATAPVLPTSQNDYAEVPLPAPLPRFPLNNPATDGWSIVDDGTVVRGGP